MSKELYRISRSSETKYPACLFRIPEDSGRALWQVTNVCNYRCSYCIFASGPRKIQGELDTATSLRAVKDLAECGFKHLKITGGEPFVRKDLLAILAETRKYDIQTDVSSNASLINRNTARELRELCISMLHVSLDGADRTAQELVRGKGTYSPSIRGLEYLLENDIYVRIGCVLHKGNEHSIRNMVEFCAEIGANELAFSIMEPAGRIFGDYTNYIQRSLLSLSDELASLRDEFSKHIAIQYNFEANKCSSGACPGGERFIFINNFGQIAPCTWLLEKGLCQASSKSLKEHSLENILSSGNVKAFRTWISNKNAAGCEGCPANWKEVRNAA